MKKRIILLVVVLFVLSACGSTATETQTEAESQSEQGYGNTNKQSRNNASSGQEETYGTGSGKGSNQSPESSHVNSDLTPDDIEGLLFMREEEKLARDVYLQLDGTWNMNVFANISNSEQTHMDALLTLIDGYGLDDPVQLNEVGDFTNPDLQALYDELVINGSSSLGDALLVGGAIEEIDILDLQEYLAITSNRDLREVYENLLKGSINHLGAFVSAYERQTGETYQPQYLSEDDYQDLMSMSSKNSRGQGRGKNASSSGNGQAR